MGDFKIFDWLIGAISSLLGVLYLTLTSRIAKLEKRCDEALPSEFERSELTRQRIATEANIKRIFETLDEMKDRATMRHLELLEKIEEKADK